MHIIRIKVAYIWVLSGLHLPLIFGMCLFGTLIYSLWLDWLGTECLGEFTIHLRVGILLQQRFLTVRRLVKREHVVWCLCCHLRVGDTPTTDRISIRDSEGDTLINGVRIRVGKTPTAENFGFP